MEQALALARSLDHPFTLAHARRFGAAFYLSQGERDAGREQVDATLALATEHGFKSFLTVGRFHHGWLLAKEGRDEEGLALMREWVTVCRSIRGECMLPTYLAWLAEALGKTGRLGEGLDLVNEALGAATESGYGYWTAELHRLKGSLTLESIAGKGGARQAHAGASEEVAEASFLEAIEVARRQRAKSFELRAAMSLGRLWARQGKTRQALALLQDVYDWFTEGLDTADLSEAKSLLGDLWRRAAGRPA
jgi:predicted ATPase